MIARCDRRTAAPLDEGMAGRLVLVTDVDLPAAVRQACADLAAALANQAGMPVTVAAVPISRLDALEDSLRRDPTAQRREYAPAARLDPAAPMTSAPFLWRPDGRPDWGGMWTTFCELALYGGPPQRGPESALRATAALGRGLRRRDARRDAPRDLGDDGALHRVGRARLALDHLRLADDGRVDVRGDHSRERRRARGRRSASAPGRSRLPAEGRGEEHHHGGRQDASLLASARRRHGRVARDRSG